MGGSNRWAGWRQFQFHFQCRPLYLLLREPLLLTLVLSVVVHVFWLQPVQAPTLRLISSASASSLPVSITLTAAPRPLLQPRAEANVVEELETEKVEVEEIETSDLHKAKPEPVIKGALLSTPLPLIAKSSAEKLPAEKSRPEKQTAAEQERPEGVTQSATEQAQRVQAQVVTAAPALTNDRLLPVITEPSFSAKPQPPVYPKLALKRRWQGQALVQALVNEQGITERVELIESTGYALLDQSALKAVSGWSFAAAESDGLYQRAWVQVPVNFTIR